ncbi:hypothetical protein HPP92_027285, partial [Vanilla planifolia]
AQATYKVEQWNSGFPAPAVASLYLRRTHGEGGALPLFPCRVIGFSHEVSGLRKISRVLTNPAWVGDDRAVEETEEAVVHRVRQVLAWEQGKLQGKQGLGNCRRELGNAELVDGTERGGQCRGTRRSVDLVRETALGLNSGSRMVSSSAASKRGRRVEVRLRTADGVTRKMRGGMRKEGKRRLDRAKPAKGCQHRRGEK